MAILPRQRPAGGGPGDTPTWSRSDKQGIGTAFSESSQLWYSMAEGVVTEVYYPTIDTPQIRDLQYLATDGATYFHDGRRNFTSAPEVLDGGAPGFRLTNTAQGTPYTIIEEIISAPEESCLLVHTRVQADQMLLNRLHLYALLAPHLGGRGWDNSGDVAETAYGRVLVASREATWLALGATVPFLKCSCGYIGATDGWTDIIKNRRLMSWEFDTAPHGNIALTGEIDLSRGPEFILGLAFGSSLNSALVTLWGALALPFSGHRSRFLAQWQGADQGIEPAGYANVTGDGGRLYRICRNVLTTHEDKTYDGALIASLSVPWGDHAQDDPDPRVRSRGYHLVWTRDMCNSASALLASGDRDAPLRSLIYLASVQLPTLDCSDRPYGGFYQNFYVTGEASQRGIQLDETAFPVMLAWRMHRMGALQGFDPYPMVLRCAGYLIAKGPITPQERWEETGGYSPSTLASNIAALVCAAAFARAHGDQPTEKFLLDYADFLEAHIESWTVTTQGTVVPGSTEYYVRLNSTEAPYNPPGNEDPNQSQIRISNTDDGRGNNLVFPAKDVVDAGFLELVRYGIRAPDDRRVVESLAVVDKVLKVDFQGQGPCWHRYNHDGYGQYVDGRPYDGKGHGGPWPLLTGERGHYELAARGVDAAKPYIRAMENFATSTGLISEQLWEFADLGHLVRGQPTGAAMPLAWAHAEYVKLVRSAVDGKVFDRIDEVADRYLNPSYRRSTLEVWSFIRQVRAVPHGATVRILNENPFRLHWSNDGSDDNWENVQDTDSNTAVVGVSYVDIPVPPSQRMPIRFTFFWPNNGTWEGRNFRIDIQ
jgi:glucoamylase